MKIVEAINKYLEVVHISRSVNTFKTYKNGMDFFSQVLIDKSIDLIKEDAKSIKEEYISWITRDLKVLSPSTEQCYLTAISGFYSYLIGENIADINITKVRLLIKQRSRRPGIRLPQFPKAEIEKVLYYAQELMTNQYKSIEDGLINKRDGAFLLTLADTGLRVHEACQLRRGDIDWNEYRAAIIGKGNRQDIIRFSKRSILAIKDYLRLRTPYDGESGKPLQSLPIFSRHDKAAGKFIKPISTTTGRQIVADRVKQLLGDEAVGKITPHSFRHYFVTTILNASGNLKLAQELARHKNISVTQRYSHLANDELDKKYLDIFG